MYVRKEICVFCQLRLTCWTCNLVPTHNVLLVPSWSLEFHWLVGIWNNPTLWQNLGFVRRSPPKTNSSISQQQTNAERTLRKIRSSNNGNNNNGNNNTCDLNVYCPHTNILAIHTDTHTNTHTHIETYPTEHTRTCTHAQLFAACLTLKAGTCNNTSKKEIIHQYT